MAQSELRRFQGAPDHVWINTLACGSLAGLATLTRAVQVASFQAAQNRVFWVQWDDFSVGECQAASSMVWVDPMWPWLFYPRWGGAPFR